MPKNDLTCCSCRALNCCTSTKDSGSTDEFGACSREGSIVSLDEPGVSAGVIDEYELSSVKGRNGKKSVWYGVVFIGKDCITPYTENPHILTLRIPITL
jgi:hypothetical protein